MSESTDATAGEVPELVCGSCETGMGVDDSEKNRWWHVCHGCDRIVCETCSLVFEHTGAGEHGTGDPQERVEFWREREARFKDILEQVRELLAAVPGGADE